MSTERGLDDRHGSHDATLAPRAADFLEVLTEQLRDELPPQQFSAWIKPLSVAVEDAAERRLRIGAPNRFKLDWVKSQFGTRIAEIAERHFDGPATIDFVVDAKAASPEPSQPVNGTATVRSLSPVARDIGETMRPAASTVDMPFTAPAPTTVSPYSRSKLEPDLTFDKFVTGKANQLARAAAAQVADNPGKSYNPLFLHGGVGLGKTHLIHAVGNQIMARKPEARIRYIHANDFVADVVQAYKGKAFDQFKREYHTLDLLLIDDIQFFQRKEGTQEQFFYTFEALASARKQIIITSDTYPAEMQGIDERLVSRFGSGLTVAVEPPELEMRVAILMKKAEQDGRTITEDVAFFIAKHSRSNVRELEGALRTLYANADFLSKRDITVEMAREALRDLVSVQRAQISVESIQKIVADYYKIKVADMYSQRRPSNIARPRQIAMYFAKELTQKSLPEIGELFGGRDHTTVLHAVRKVNELRGKHPEINHQLHVLTQMLKG